jgi:uncharacterized membrane protein YtjA (UPF0391 family)
MLSQLVARVLVIFVVILLVLSLVLTSIPGPAPL